MRSTLLIILVGASGCVSLPHARLLGGQGVREVFSGPVVCGPVGFRKVPLQARWGEYVRVTVAAPAALRGTVLVHAGGVTQEPQSFSTELNGALVIDAHFPNEDPDRRFALNRERPIDITLTGLEGTCEGAVFTVEHGELVPSVDERAWIAELERRGGPELAARREDARRAAEDRRQAHYAQWAMRQQVEVSVELREAHYAQWEARHSPLPPGEGLGAGLASSGVIEQTTPEAEVAQNPSGGLIAVGSASCATGSCAGIGSGAGSVSTSSASCTTGSCAGIGSTGTVSTSTASCSTGLCAAGIESQASTSITSVGSAAAEWNTPVAFTSESGSCTTGSCAVQPLHPSAPSPAVTTPGEWSQPSDTTLRASAELPPAQLQVNAAVESSWTQPFEPRLEALPVNTQTHVVTRAAPIPPCTGGCGAEPSDSSTVIVPALFQMFFNLAAAAPPPASPPHHAAVPVR